MNREDEKTRGKQEKISLGRCHQLRRIMQHCGENMSVPWTGDGRCLRRARQAGGPPSAGGNSRAASVQSAARCSAAHCRSLARYVGVRSW